MLRLSKASQTDNLGVALGAVVFSEMKGKLLCDKPTWFLAYSYRSSTFHGHVGKLQAHRAGFAPHPTFA